MLLFLSVSLALAASETELIDQVLAEYPALADGTRSDWETVQALRAFAYTHTDTVVTVSSPLYTRVTDMDASAAYAWFDADSGGVVCGGTSEALVKLLQLWGYDAWYLGFGDPSDGGFTHVETLIRIEHEGASLITLHDAQLNVAYTEPGGAPLDYLEVLARLARGEHEAIALTDPDGVTYADTLVHPDDFGTLSVEAMASANWTTDPDDYTVEVLASGVTKYRSPRTRERLEAVIGPWYEPFLESQGLPPELPYLHLFPFTIFGSDGGEAILADALATISADSVTTIGFEAGEGFVLGETDGTINWRYDEAGYDVQTWYYGGTTIAAVEGGQALQAAGYDGLGGDFEAMLEFQASTYGQVGASLAPLEADAAVRFAVYDSAGALLDEQIGGAGVYTSAREGGDIHHVVVEAERGDLLVDDFTFGPYQAPEVPGDTGDTGGAPPEDTGLADTGGLDSAAPADSDSPDPVDTDPPADEAPAEVAKEAGCSCGGGAGAGVGWIALLLAALRRRPTRRAGRITHRCT